MTSEKLNYLRERDTFYKEQYEMAHGQRAEHNSNSMKEYWKSRLHRYGEVIGRYTKRLTHRKERRQSKDIVAKEIKELN
jgi:hypothetical protein